MKKAQVPVIDLHCDLLSYLAFQPGRTADHPVSRASYPQLTSGNVKLQTLAIFSSGGEESAMEGKVQVDHFLKLIAQEPTRFKRCAFPLDAQSNQVQLLPAFENASTFATESEPLSHAFKRFEEYIRLIGLPFYISMTWNEENRFGGGNATNVGLKSDGKHLLEWISSKKIAIDLSHTSDPLAYEIIDAIDTGQLDVPLIASHSNFRAITHYPRNLPQEIAQEIIRRKGLIGLNFFAPFIHASDYTAVLRHVEYGLSLGGENALCFGADFFCDADFPDLLKKYQTKQAYFPELADASTYPALLGLFAEKLAMKEEQLLKISSQNALQFLKRLHHS